MDNINEIYVYENWKSDLPSLIGTMYVDGNRGKQIVSFEYSDEWLKDLSNNVTLDPDLRLFKGRQYTPPNKLMFGAFEDSCPDRWGRLLMKRREAINAKKEERKPRNLSEVDYLIGVYDETRMGGLRFSLSRDGEFVSSDKEMATPPWTTLRKLESASLAFEKDDDGNEEKWLKQLVAPGSSLGGARPKASVIAPDGSLWIAKFPSRNDDINVGAWEMVAHDLAILCKLDVPEAKIEDFSKNGSTFIVKRFDRSGSRRIHFASAMTLLGQTDGADASGGSSYFDIASFIKMYSATPKKDLHELWRRIVFNMAVSNTDDHLRNHGFILNKDGWWLSPMYDVNPSAYGNSLSLNVDSYNNAIDFDIALSVSEMFEVAKDKDEEEIREISSIVESSWRQIAKDYGIGRGEIERMVAAFDMRYKF